jgi:NAD(P)-dependent dehydrogenase (short-subunit alcohol dehydrogenase family)
MQTGVIAVMGATRNIGRKIADALLKADEKVRALWPVGEHARRTEARRLVKAGLSESFAKRYVEMTRAFNEGMVNPNRTPGNTTFTQFEDFAD